MKNMNKKTHTVPTKARKYKMMITKYEKYKHI